MNKLTSILFLVCCGGVTATAVAHPHPDPRLTALGSFECPAPLDAYDGYLRVQIYNFAGEVKYSFSLDVGGGSICQEQKEQLRSKRSRMNNLPSVIAICRKYALSDGWVMNSWTVGPFGQTSRRPPQEFVGKEECYDEAAFYNSL